ncbi:MAG: hypothetical protein BGP03_09860 [Pseudonocardia sp. 73-21]|uniref:hypothetical protein n=1 Tax=uncultured Pseudonocardia sp. TaxID=211455 RepID=UPI000964FE7E|nr:hypothetical protein [uncultured Pseudonocardia sp.]OJY42171.1 MAG: hypothetical protein BGP03_09860 [Pseudonocardia sp. 73-21]
MLRTCLPAAGCGVPPPSGSGEAPGAGGGRRPTRRPTSPRWTPGPQFPADARPTADSGAGRPGEPAAPGSRRRRDEPVAPEPASAVVVGVRSVAVGAAPTAAGPGCAVAAVGRNAEYTVPLAAPWGGRVLRGVDGVDPTPVLAVVPG